MFRLTEPNRSPALVVTQKGCWVWPAGAAPAACPLVRRHCGNPECVNPMHAMLGAAPKNKPRTIRRRIRRDKRHVLSDAQVREIRTSTAGLQHFADKFGVGVATVFRVRHGFTYKES